MENRELRAALADAGIDGFVDGPFGAVPGDADDWVVLDGHFTAAELRRIADLINPPKED